MPQTIQRPTPRRSSSRRVTPSRVDAATAKPFTLEQELEPFGAWVGNHIWVPPKDSSPMLAESTAADAAVQFQGEALGIGDRETPGGVYPSS